MRVRKKYQVFVSSTFDDLAHERQVVTWALLKSRYIPVGMEAFSATDDRGWKTITATIDDSDYYVLIVAGKLGTVDAATGLSWTRREYEYARSKGVPVLAFVRSEAAILHAQSETEPNRAEKLKEFIELVERNHHRERWHQESDLVSQVSTALNNHVQDDEHEGKERPGWYRGDHLPVSSETLDELARLSRENAELRANLAAQTERPRLELLYDGEPVSSELVVGHQPVRLPSRASPPHFEMLALTPSVGSSPAKIAQAINEMVWLRFSLRNIGQVSARNVRVTISASPVQGIEIYPESLAVVPLNDQRKNPAAHVYVDSVLSEGSEGSVVQRIRSIHPDGEEKLVKFAVRFLSTKRHPTFDCNVSATDEGGTIFSEQVSFAIAQSPPREISEDDVESYDGVVAKRIATAT